ncbi:hypothetical protein D3C72_1904800 [compost metagenome]
MVRHRGRPADRAKEDGVIALKLGLPVWRHHVAMARVVLAIGPGKGVDLQRQPVALGRGVHGTQALGHHFVADAVAGDGRDLENLRHDCLTGE